MFVYMYIYRVKRRGVLHDYSNEYDTQEEAENWYNLHGKELSKLSNRQLILYKNSRKVSLIKQNNFK